MSIPKTCRSKNVAIPFDDRQAPCYVKGEVNVAPNPNHQSSELVILVFLVLAGLCALITADKVGPGRADAEVLAMAWAKEHYYLKAGYEVRCTEDEDRPLSQCVVFLNAQGKRSEVLLDCLVGPMVKHECFEVTGGE